MRENGDSIKYPLSTVITIRALIKNPSDNIKIQVVDVPQASNANLSGAYSICIAHVLSKGKDPSLIKIDSKKVKSAIIKFMETSGGLDNVLSANRRPKNNSNILFHWKEKLYCICKLPDNGKRYIRCKKCQKWYHFTCVNVAAQVEDWNCEFCDSTKRLRKKYVKYCPILPDTDDDESSDGSQCTEEDIVNVLAKIEQRKKEEEQRKKVEEQRKEEEKQMMFKKSADDIVIAMPNIEPIGEYESEEPELTDGELELDEKPPIKIDEEKYSLYLESNEDEIFSLFQTVKPEPKTSELSLSDLEGFVYCQEANHIFCDFCNRSRKIKALAKPLDTVEDTAADSNKLNTADFVNLLCAVEQVVIKRFLGQ